LFEEGKNTIKTGNPAGKGRYYRALVLLLVISVCILPATAAPLTNNRHIFINVANDAGVKYDLDGAKYGGPSNTYYIKADGGGLNELHITNDAGVPHGQVSSTTAQTGVFYVTNTGGRGFDNDIILLIAVKEPVPDSFSVTIKSSGYTWTPAVSGAYTPPPPAVYTHVTNAVSETFTKSDLIYGSQNWKPGPGALGDLPVYNGQDMSDAGDQYHLMFVDLKAGNMDPVKFPSATLTDNGAIKIEYSFTDLDTFAAFNAYGWCTAANQDQGISWTNPTAGFVANGPQQSGQSGFTVTGVPITPSSRTRGWNQGSSVAVLPTPGSVLPADTAAYGYKGKMLNTYKTGTLNGSVRFFSDSASQPAPANNRIREYDLSVDLPPDSNISFARMYLYLSAIQNIQSQTGVYPSFDITLDGKFLKPDQVYIDNDGDEHRRAAATYAYDVRDFLKGNGTYHVSVRNMDFEQYVFTIEDVLLVTAYETETAPPTHFWINEGCDVIKSLPREELFPNDCQTSYPFSGTVNMSTAGAADLYLVSTGLDHDNSTEHTVSFNEGKWPNFLDSGNGSLIMHLPVRTYLNATSNKADVQSTIRKHDADYLVNRNAILIVSEKDPDAPAPVQDTNITGREQKAPPADLSDPLFISGESSHCRITLNTDPEGALVYMDGLYLGKTTPYTLDAQRGESHTVRFERDGYVPSESSFAVTNSTCIHTSLYTPVHSSKDRLAEQLEDPDGVQSGSLYVNSRPSGATISIDGTNTEKTTPSLITGIKPGSHTVKVGGLKGNTLTSGQPEFVFEEQTVLVVPDVIIPVDINGIGNNFYTDVIIDSRANRGSPFTVDGYVNNKIIPAKMTVPEANPFLTIRENESFVSYLIPVSPIDGPYQVFEPREHQNLEITVNSYPRGAEVFIDGFRTGYTTPYTFGNISDGPHRIIVTKNGFKPQQSLIDLPWRSVPISVTPVDFILEEFPSGFLYVNSIPKGAAVSIDGMVTGDVTPVLFKSMATGAHKVKVTKGNMTKSFYDVVINSVEMKNLTADFTPVED
jgi:hypothetical protein